MSGNWTPNLFSNGHGRSNGALASGDNRNGNGKGHSVSIWVPPAVLSPQVQEFHRLQPHLNQRSLVDGNKSGEDSEDGLFHEAEPAKIIRVGKDFQAKIPSLLPYEERMQKLQCPDNALLVWSPPPPSPAHTDEMLRKYLAIAVTEHHYTHDQALGLLFWHRYNISRALWDLPKFTQDPLEWTPEDKILFDHAFKLYGKSFDQVQSVLPNKSIRSLIKYYYDWKRNHLSRKASASLPNTVTDSDSPVQQVNTPSPSQANGNSRSGSEQNATARTGIKSSRSHLQSNPMYAQFRNLSVTNNTAPLSPLLLPDRRLHQQHAQPQLRLQQQRQQNLQSNSNHYVPLQGASSSPSGSGSGSGPGQWYHANGNANNANRPDFEHDPDDVIVIE